MPVINFIWLFGQQNIDRHGRGQKNFSNNRNVLWKQIGFRRQHRKKTIVALLFRVFRGFFSRVPFRSYRTHGERGDPTPIQHSSSSSKTECGLFAQSPRAIFVPFEAWFIVPAGGVPEFGPVWVLQQLRMRLYIEPFCVYVCVCVLLVYRAKSSIFQIFPFLNRVPNGHPRHIGFGAVFRFAALVSLTRLVKKNLAEDLQHLTRGPWFKWWSIRGRTRRTTRHTLSLTR